MEPDNQLKKILIKGAESASVDFTANLMTKISGLSINTFYYKPLVSKKFKKIFVYTFITLVLFILILCLMITLPALPFISQIKIPQVSTNLYFKIFGSILSFWLVFGTNFFIQRKKLFTANK